MPTRGRWLGIVLVLGAGVGLTLPMLLPSPAGGDPLPARVMGAVAVVAFAIGGAAIIWRHPRHPIGWLFAGFAVSEAIVQASTAWAWFALVENAGTVPGGHFAGWVYAWAWAFPSTLPLFMVLLFPDGSLPRRRWRLLVRVAAAALVTLALGSSLYPKLFQDQERWPTGIDNPFGVPGATPVLEVVTAVAMLVLAVSALLAAVSVVVRYRRADELQRQQLRLVLGAGLLVAIAAALPTPDLVVLGLLALLAVTATLTVLRHGLYDVQLAASRSLVYGTLAAITTVVYLVVVAGVGSVADAQREIGLPIAIVATAAAAVLFQPLRARVERRARRLVFGPQAEPYSLLTDLSHRLAGALPLDEVAETIAETMARGLRASSVTVSVLGHEGVEQPTTVPSDAVGPRHTVVDEVEAVHDGRGVGRITVRSAPERWGPTEARLLRDMAAHAAPALSNVALAAELRERAEELAASRRRLVAAQDRERRRIERDLHDGAQQYLVGIGAQLGLARQRLRDPELHPILDRAVGLADEAAAALRSLARGVYPHVLLDRGLVPALRAHLDNSVLPFSTRVVGSDARWNPDAEAAAYFCCLEAIQNAARHSGANAVEVVVDDSQGDLSFSVIDDGIGIEPGRERSGHGITNLADRVGALGGTVAVRRAPGGGTEMSGRIPVTRLPARTGTARRLGPDGALRAPDPTPASRRPS